MVNNIKDIVVVLYEAPDKGGGDIKDHTDILRDSAESTPDHWIIESPKIDYKSTLPKKIYHLEAEKELKMFEDTDYRIEETLDNL